MDNHYLQDLIDETKNRGGGMILNLEGKPEVVVLMVEKYNQLMEQVTSDRLQVTNNAETSEPQEISISSTKSKILVTGGAGYIGAHVVSELINSGYEVIVVDNLSTGKKENLDQRAKFYEGDLADINFMRDVFASEKISAVMHFAASIEVAESIKEPLKYFENNTANTANLLKVMDEAGVRQIIFSSTAAVYGQSEKLLAETAPVKPANPYGFSKLLAEKNIKYFCQYKNFKAIIFRYFNASGCREAGDVIPTHQSHLIDNVTEVAVGRKPFVEVYGTDFPTFDGSGVRDYVSVEDIAEAHVLALNHFSDDNFQVFNIGTGKGRSVIEIISTASEVLGKIIPMEMREKRQGDPAEVVADNTKILSAWGFSPKKSDLETILKSAYRQKIGNIDI